jgi:hypothetical protein
MELARVKIYRMTHIKNIPHILEYGITHKSSPNANPNFVAIGDVSLIDTRSGKRVRISNGDNFRADAPSIVLGDFIPFYFGIRMPMLYVVQNGGNFVQTPTRAEDIIYLVCSVSDIAQSTNAYYFSDGHATDNLTTFYGADKIHELPNLVNWDAVKASYWGGQENLNIKRKKQAEFLIASDLPPHLLVGFGCFNQDAKQRLMSMGVGEEKIKIIPNGYY